MNTIDVGTQTPMRGPDFASFFAEARPRLVRAIAVTLGDAELAADSVDEAMARAWDRWDVVRDLDAPAGWVYRVALNLRDLPFLYLADDGSTSAGCDGSAASESPETAGILDDPAQLTFDFTAEMVEIGAEPLADGLSNRANGLDRDFGQTLGDGLDLTRENRPAGGAGVLRLHAGCVGDGVATILAQATGTTNTAVLRPSDPFPCDGSTHRLDLVAAPAPVAVAAHEGLVTTGAMIAVLTDDDLGDTDLSTG